jgi:flavodoxin
MTTRVIYATMTRHSKKLAEAIAKNLDVKAENIKGAPILKDVDLLFIVGGIYGGESLPALLDFVRHLDSGAVKRAALITSCTSQKQGQRAVGSLLEEKGIDVLGEIICQGSFLFMGFGHPNQADVDEVVRFARSLAEEVGAST